VASCKVSGCSGLREGVILNFLCVAELEVRWHCKASDQPAEGRKPLDELATGRRTHSIVFCTKYPPGSPVEGIRMGPSKGLYWQRARPRGRLQRPRAGTVVDQSEAGVLSIVHSSWRTAVSAPDESGSASDSSLQSEEHPSPSLVLPSSHCSRPTSLESPHVSIQGLPSTQLQPASAMHDSSQPSPETRFPSSHVSSPDTCQERQGLQWRYRGAVHVISSAIHAL